MPVVVNLPPGQGNQQTHQAGTLIEVNFDTLYVYGQPDVPVAVYAKGAWDSAVVS